MIREMEVPSVNSIVEVPIITTLLNLRDLCFVILEFIKNDEARQIIRFVSEVILKWKNKKTNLSFEPKPEYKVQIRSKLGQMYLSTIKDQQIFMAEGIKSI